MKTRRTCKVFAIALAMALCAALLAPVYAEEILPQSIALGESSSTPVSSSSDSTSGGTTTPVDGAGTPYIAAYTVTDASGNELQRIQEGQKCRIIVAVVDPRINNPALLTLANGQPLLGNVKVVSTGTFASPSLGDISTTTFTADKVDANGLHFSIILNDITYLGGTSNDLVLDLAYNDNARALVTLKQGISQCGVSTEQGGKATALVVKSASYGSGDVTAGENFTLNASILASNGTSGAENVTISLKLPEEITVVSGSSYLFLGNMKPGATAEASFQLTASAVAKAGSYNISIEVAGNSASDGTGMSASMPITVPVVQPDRFEIANVNLPESLMMGQESYGTVSLVNKGKGSVYNVEAELAGEGFTVDEGSKKFIGNIASGSQNSQDFSVTATQAGTLTAQLIITYEDEKANVKTLTRDITMTVDEGMIGGGGGIDDGMIGGGGMEIPETPKAGMPVWGWILIVLVVAGVAAAVIITVVKKKKAKRRAAQLMEDDDEDI